MPWPASGWRLEAIPPSRRPQPSVVALRAEGAARLAASEAAPDDAPTLFGEGFAVLALGAPPNPDALAASLADDPIANAPTEVVAPMGGARTALVSWIEAHGRVRASIGLLADVLLAARLRETGGATRLRAVQQPAAPFPEAAGAQQRQWVGLPFPAALGPQPVTSMVASTLGTLDPSRGIAVLVIDEHADVTPGPETTTGLAFGYDAPGARPPQSILLAVPPVAGSAWTLESLAAVVGETLDLAKVRMVDLSSVAWAGRFVPTIYLTDGDLASGLDVPMKDLVRLADARAKAVIDP